MKGLKLILIFYFLFHCFSVYAKKKKEYVCFYLMNTEIRHTVEENERQKDMRNGASQNYLMETQNKKQFEKLNSTTKNIRSRLSSVSLLMQGIPVGWNISRFIKGTYEYQEKIYEELSDAPAFIIMALPDQFKFAEHLKDNTLFIYGIIATYGVINQMESAERKILLKYAESEFEALFFEAMLIHSKIRTAKSAWQWKKQMFFASIEEDKKMFEDIIKQF